MGEVGLGIILASGAKKLDQEASGLCWILLSAENLKIPINYCSGIIFLNKIYSDFHEKYWYFHQISSLLSFPLYFHALKKINFFLMGIKTQISLITALRHSPNFPANSSPWRGHFMHQDNLVCPGGKSIGESGNGNNWTLIF